MPKPTKECDGFIMDTYRTDNHYVPGVITVRKNRTVEVLQWKRSFSNQDDANTFVRAQLHKWGIPEAPPR